MIASTRTTHVKQFRSCPMAWRLTAVEQVPQPKRKSLEFGTLVHREMELWWLHGTEPQRAGAVLAAKKVQEFIDRLGVKRGSGHAEWSFRDTVGSITYGGQADLIFATPEGEWWLLDYKTSADIDKYGLTGWQLAHDLQLGVYAHQVFSQLAPGVRSINVAHVQIATVDAMGRTHTDAGFEPRVEIETAAMSNMDAARIWVGATETVSDMARVAGLTLSEVPGNTEHCGAYGGCAYRSRCHHYAASTTTTEDPMYQPATPPAQQAYTHTPQPRLWVLIDTLPEQAASELPQPVQHLDYILHPLQQQVAAENRVPLYSMVQFGQGPKQVVAKLAASAPLTGTVLVDSMSPCANDAVEFLRPKASLVLRRSR